MEVEVPPKQFNYLSYYTKSIPKDINIHVKKSKQSNNCLFVKCITFICYIQKSTVFVT
jgi:hypothetical protein